MGTLIVMPKLSDTMKEGVIVSWLKKEGEEVQRSEPLLEVETDKAVMEVEAPTKGFLLKRFFSEQERVPLGEPLAIIGEKKEKWESILEHHKKDKIKARTNPESLPKEKRDSKNKPKTPQKTSSSPKASPYARKLAQEAQISLEGVFGSGPNGRILARDVTSLQSPSSSIASKHSVKPLSLMRQRIAQKMVESIQSIPHFYLKTSFQAENLLNLQKKLKTEQNHLSLNDCFNYFVAKVLKHHPLLRSFIQNDSLHTPPFLNLAFAVSLEEGLMTPIIQKADQLSLEELSLISQSLIEKSHKNRLSPDEIHSGHFTTSNLGSLGIEEFTSIIQPPQVAILSIGTISKDDFTCRLTLGCDHRLIDGATGARFLKDLQKVLEDPAFLLRFL